METLLDAGMDPNRTDAETGQLKCSQLPQFNDLKYNHDRDQPSSRSCAILQVSQLKLKMFF